MSDDPPKHTTSFLRLHVYPYVDTTVGRRLDEFTASHRERSLALHNETMQRLSELAEFQNVMHRTILGELPPDPAKPGMWQSLVALLAWKRNVSKFIWIAATAILGLTVKAIWMALAAQKVVG